MDEFTCAWGEKNSFQFVFALIILVFVNLMYEDKLMSNLSQLIIIDPNTSTTYKFAYNLKTITFKDFAVK